MIRRSSHSIVPREIIPQKHLEGGSDDDDADDADDDANDEASEADVKDESSCYESYEIIHHKMLSVKKTVS